MVVNVYIEPSRRRIQPFDDPVGEVPIINRPLRSWLEAAIGEAGLTVIDGLRPPCLVVPDNLFVSGGALRRFVEEAGGRDAVYVLGESRFGKSTTAMQVGVVAIDGGWRFEKVRWDSGKGGEPVDVVIDPEERVLEMPISRVFLGTDEPVELGVPRHAIACIDHWFHLLWINHLARGIDLRNERRATLALRILWAIVRSFSINRWKVLGRLNRIGKGCDIHPTATVEASTLGKGVKIGPYARVFMSHLDDGAEVMGQASVELAALGKNSIVAQNCVARLCVLYPDAVSAQDVIQQSVLGRGCVMTAGSYTYDLNFENDIRVELDGRLQSTGWQFLGSAFGHGSRIGTGIHLASGREIPNGYKILRDPAAVLTKIEKGLPTDVQLRAAGRVLEPLGGKTTEG